MTSCLDAKRRNGKDWQHEIIEELVHLLLCSNTNISSWPVGLQNNRAKKGFTGLTDTLTKLAMNLNPKQDRLEL